MQQKFFGDPDSPLFGVFHPARGRSGSNRRAVLICPPIGQEYIRSHWCLRLLANQLARKGMDVLRFDYHGIGDSAGRIVDISSPETWANDIRRAVEHLKSESGAQAVTLLGLRIGATIAAHVAKDNPDVNGVALWEPVTDGRAYLDSLRNVHQQMLDLWVCRMETPDNDSHEEILGSRYSRSLVQQIEQLEMDPAAFVQPQLIVQQQSDPRTFDHPVEGIQRVLSVDDEDDWTDLSVLEVAWLRPLTTQKIVKQIDEMHSRLAARDSLDGLQSATPEPALPAGV